MAAEPAGAERLRAVPAPQAESPDASPRRRTALRWGLAAVLLWSPLPFASVQPWAVLVLELGAAGLAALALVVAGRDGRGRHPPLVPAALAAGLLLIGVLQVLPVFPSAGSGPGASARSNLAALAPEAVAVRIPWSFSAPETVDAVTRLAAYVLLGLVATVAIRSRRHALDVAIAIVASALFQSFYGTAEYLSGRSQIFGYAKQYYLDCATGTFVNRNHFAGFLALALPFALAATSSLRGGAASPLRRIAWAAIGAAAALVLLIGILLSRSRAGLAVSLLAVATYVLAAAPRRILVWGVSGLLALAVVFVLGRDVNVPAERFASLGEDLAHPAGRIAVWEESLGLIREWPGLGYGLGTFDPVYRERTALHASGRYDHAHNDHLQGILEGGLPAYALFAGLAITVGARALRRSRRDVFAAASIAAATALGLHALLDFPVRIPALALFGAVLVGMLASVQGGAPYAARTSPASERDGGSDAGPRGSDPPRSSGSRSSVNGAV